MIGPYLKALSSPEFLLASQKGANASTAFHSCPESRSDPDSKYVEFSESYYMIPSYSIIVYHSMI